MNASCSLLTHRARGRRGQALMAALLVVAFMTALLGSMSLGLMVEARRSRAKGDHVAAHYLARSGLAAAADQLIRDDTSWDALSDPWHTDTAALEGVRVDIGQYDVSYVSPATGQAHVGVIDEERCVNINTADANMLRNLDPAFTEDIAMAVVGRRGKRPFVAVVELQALPQTPGGFLDQPRAGVEGGLGALLTVFGDGKINVCTAPLPVLRTLGVLNEEQMKVLVARRDGKDGKPGTADDEPFTDVSEVQSHLELSDGEFARLKPLITVSSRHFTITATGWLDSNPLMVSELRQVVRRNDGGLDILRFEQLR